LIDDKGRPRICDFGLTKISGQDSTMITTTSHTGTLRYLAYELAGLSEGVISPTIESDIYALGLLGLEVKFFRDRHFKPTLT
jgi:serine/threonine protein kinase